MDRFCPCGAEYPHCGENPMKKKSVVLIETIGNESNVFENHMQLPLTGMLYLGTILHNHGFDVTILNEHILGKKIDPFEVRADVFCITALTVSANRAKLLASQFKKIYPSALVIMGGIHATLLPDEFADVADHIVTGEAESVIVDVVNGVYTEKIIPGTLLSDLDTLPLVNYRLIKGFENIPTIPIMTSRGCPFDCNFCTVTKIFGRKFRMQSVERILAEIKNSLSIFKTRRFFFYDDNFTANRKRIDALCEALVEQKIEISWDAQVRSDLAKHPDLLKKMAQAGCSRVFIGFESIDDHALEAMNKSQSRKDIESSIRAFHRFGIRIHGMFMFGEDNDTLDNINDTVDFALKHEIDTVQFMILTPIPGTTFYERIVAEKRLLHKNWDYYDGMYVVFEPKNMSALRLQKKMVSAYNEFYSLRRTALNVLDFVFNIFLDSMVWNFRRAFRYNIDTIFLRVASKVIVNNFSQIYTGYLKYLEDIEAKPVVQKEVVETQ